MSDKPRFTEEDLRKLNDAVWKDPPESAQATTTTPCPVCGANTRVLISWSSTGSCAPAVLKFNCERCQRYGSVAPAEARCPDFSEAFMRTVAERSQYDQDSVCPTCQTRLTVESEPAFGGRLYSAYCLRGGAMGQLSA